MSKFHINKKGIPSQCRAKDGNCPLGGDEQHFGTKDEAVAFVEKQKSTEFGILPEMKNPDPQIAKNNEEIAKLKASISDTTNKAREGLFLDDEVVSTLYRMMGYYEDKIKRMEKENEELYRKDGLLSPKMKAKEDIMKLNSVKEIEAYVEDMLQEHHQDALEHTCKHFGVKDNSELQKFDSQQQTMDCGWLHWRVDEPDINEKLKKLTKEQYGYVDNTLRINLPVRVQGTLIQSVAANYLKDKVSDKISLTYRVHLD